MKFRELYISQIRRNHKSIKSFTADTRSKRKLREAVNVIHDAQIILLSNEVADEVLTQNQGHPRDVKVVNFLDVPFKCFYLEAVDRDLVHIHFGNAQRHVPVVGSFYYKKTSQPYQVLRVCLNTHNNIKGQPDQVYFQSDHFGTADLNYIKALNSRKNGWAKCQYNKKDRHTGNALVKEIVYCQRVKYLKTEKLTIDSKPFKYSHRFDVRGHWRKVKTIGKDPEGTYCIPGHTWVSPFKKGQGNYIKKDRIFLN